MSKKLSSNWQGKPSSAKKKCSNNSTLISKRREYKSVKRINSNLSVTLKKQTIRVVKKVVAAIDDHLSVQAYFR